MVFLSITHHPIPTSPTPPLSHQMKKKKKKMTVDDVKGEYENNIQETRPHTRKMLVRKKNQEKHPWEGEREKNEIGNKLKILKLAFYDFQFNIFFWLLPILWLRTFFFLSGKFHTDCMTFIGDGFRLETNTLQFFFSLSYSTWFNRCHHCHHDNTHKRDDCITNIYL